MKIEVTQADMECARNIRNAWDVNCDIAFQIAAQHRILATRTDATPDNSLHNVIHGEHGWRRREVQRIGAAISTRNWHDLETAYNELRDKMDRTTKPRPPATDVAEQDDTALLERLADEACKRLGIDPNEIVDPVGPVRKKDDIIYAMYAFVRDKFWDTEPNDVAALVEAAKKIMPIRVNDGPDYAEVYFADGEKHSTHAMTMNPQDWLDLSAALAPFTKGQNDG